MENNIIGTELSLYRIVRMSKELVYFIKQSNIKK
jgi:hypothetical protein